MSEVPVGVLLQCQLGVGRPGCRPSGEWLSYLVVTWGSDSSTGKVSTVLVLTAMCVCHGRLGAPLCVCQGRLKAPLCVYQGRLEAPQNCTTNNNLTELVVTLSSPWDNLWEFQDLTEVKVSFCLTVVACGAAGEVEGRRQAATCPHRTEGDSSHVTSDVVVQLRPDVT